MGNAETDYGEWRTSNTIMGKVNGHYITDYMCKHLCTQCTASRGGGGGGSLSSPVVFFDAFANKLIHGGLQRVGERERTSVRLLNHPSQRLQKEPLHLQHMGAVEGKSELNFPNIQKVPP